MNYRCLQCQGVIYDRSKGNCAVCGAPLAEGSFLSAAEAELLCREAFETEEGHRRESGKLEAEEQERQDQRGT